MVGIETGLIPSSTRADARLNACSAERVTSTRRPERFSDSDVLFVDIECLMLVDLVEYLASALDEQVFAEGIPHLFCIVDGAGDRFLQATHTFTVGNEAGQSQCLIRNGAVTGDRYLAATFERFQKSALGTYGPVGLGVVEEVDQSVGLVIIDTAFNTQSPLANGRDRDLDRKVFADLVAKGAIIPLPGGGRTTRYELKSVEPGRG